jgi:hypothetical protein
MKNLFELSTDEKKRIITLHEGATKRLYLVEQQVIQGGENDPYQYKKTGDKVEYAPKGTENWKVQTNPKGVQAINNLFTKSAPQNTPTPTTTTTDGTGVVSTGTTTTSTGATGAGATGTGATGAGTTGAGTTGAGTTEAGTTGTGTGGNKPSENPNELREKITNNCGEIWNSYLERLKNYQAQMKGKALDAQKDIAKEMSKDEKKTFNYCHKLYKPKLLPDEKANFSTLGANFKKFLSASYKFLAPAVVKMMSTTVEKAADAGGEAVLKSLKIGGNQTNPASVTGESRYKETDLNRLIKESIRKNTKHL